MLAAQWTRRLPLVQRVAPAELAAEVVREAIERMGEEVEEGLTVVDFCSGGGGEFEVLLSDVLVVSIFIPFAPTLTSPSSAGRTERLHTSPLPFQMLTIFILFTQTPTSPSSAGRENRKTTRLTTTFPNAHNLHPLHSNPNIPFICRKRESKDHTPHHYVPTLTPSPTGPVPTLESHINTSRRRARKPPIPFLLSDLHPHIDAWMELAARSDNLSFIPQPVDATAPPRAAMSSPSPQLEPRAVDGAPSDHTTSDLTTSGHTTHDPPPLPRTHILRTFHLSFHHFGDAAAKKVLASTLLTAHGIVITELQDRTLFSLVMMAADFLLVFPLSVVWFCCDPTFLVATWALFGLLPAVLSWDGGVSALRTRGGGEVLGLLGEGEGVGGEVGKVRSEGGEWVVVREGWEWRGGRRLHTWPIGYMNYVVGRRLGV
ncbi:hypothetical protein K490DRAFT_62722 [Saccharata proteae CBS 121410]|uniref:Uncharacterized protein n=1 Tax=Saccharata proteae CBS 121410 TaxID=1314787 RepID=A0A9P4LYF4_9PEZI|nr:hypothetical protein K490DRAFT_62722 [Saccharata proteae CBS 121410]